MTTLSGLAFVCLFVFAVHTRCLLRYLTMATPSIYALLQKHQEIASRNLGNV